MKMIDLTHLIEPGMPVYPGTEPPDFKQACRLTSDGFAEKRISLYSHTGTHLDAPAHILRGGPTLDQLPLTHFYGNALKIAVAPGSEMITPKQLASYSTALQEVAFAVFHTDWSRWWGSEQYFKGFPVLTPEAAHWLINFPLKGVGFDTISADAPQSTEFPIHKIILGGNRIIIENLRHLDLLPDTPFQLSCFPLHLRESDGSPVRAVAFVD